MREALAKDLENGDLAFATARMDAANACAERAVRDPDAIRGRAEALAEAALVLRVDPTVAHLSRSRSAALALVSSGPTLSASTPIAVAISAYGALW